MLLFSPILSFSFPYSYVVQEIPFLNAKSNAYGKGLRETYLEEWPLACLHLNSVKNALSKDHREP